MIITVAGKSNSPVDNVMVITYVEHLKKVEIYSTEVN